MTTETATVSEPVSKNAGIMASVDDDGRTKRYIVADTTVDGAWISMPVADCAPLPSWR